MSAPVANRYEFIYLFDVELGNPNGDPDAGNMPRIDYETNQGLVSDVCLKRKVRNFVQLTKSGDGFFDIFIKEKAVLNRLIERPYTEDPATQAAFEAWTAYSKNKKAPRPERHVEDVAADWMCKQYYDIRSFGAVMTTGSNKKDEQSEEKEKKSKLKKTAGQIRGPVQFSFSKSIEPITPQEVSITRMAVTNEEDEEKERTMGRKSVIPYGLYRLSGYINPYLAERTGFTEEDLGLLWDALKLMFDHDRSAARGMMSARKLIAFKHAGKLGNAPANVLFDSVQIKRVTEGPARSFSDYEVVIDKSKIPQGVEVIELL